MDLTDWFVMLAIALMAIGFYCARTRAHATLVDRSRRRLGTRLLVQGAFALWTALLTLERGFVKPTTLPFGLGVNPHAMLALGLFLVVAGVAWSVRGRRLLRARRIFGAL